MSTFFLLLILLLAFLITFQIAKASEYVGVLKGEKKNFEQHNRINGFLMMVFLVLGLIGVYWCNEMYKGKILGESASKHGEEIDRMLYITIAITGVEKIEAAKDWNYSRSLLFAANPFGYKDFGMKKSGDHTIPAGGEICFFYRVILHEGDTKSADLPAFFREYARPPKVVWNSK